MSFRHDWLYFLYLPQVGQGDICNASPVQRPLFEGRGKNSGSFVKRNVASLLALEGEGRYTVRRTIRTVNVISLLEADFW